MKWFDKLHPIAQIALVTVAVIIGLKLAAPYAAKIPFVGKYLV